jgi:hypothetical protein
MIADKRLFDLRREAGESAAILASVEAQLAAAEEREPSLSGRQENSRAGLGVLWLCWTSRRQQEKRSVHKSSV